jgi:hypothetical protein
MLDVTESLGCELGVKTAELPGGVENLHRVALRGEIAAGVEDAGEGGQGRGHAVVAIVLEHRGVGGVEVVGHEEFSELDDVGGERLAARVGEGADGGSELAAARSRHVLAQHCLQELGQQAAPVGEHGGRGLRVDP